MEGWGGFLGDQGSGGGVEAWTLPMVLWFINGERETEKTVKRGGENIETDLRVGTYRLGRFEQF